jgi:hypothetical protein
MIDGPVADDGDLRKSGRTAMNCGFTFGGLIRLCFTASEFIFSAVGRPT